jgi:ATP-dependent Clp protease, protease subunit
MRQWFRIENAANDPTTAEIHIVDFIGSWDDDWFARNFGYEMGVTARAFIEELGKLPEAVKAIHLHINSPGGDVQGGVNIANALREQMSKGRTVETFIDGIAASIASVIAMAGSKVHIADNALVMVHNPWSIAIGNAGEMRKTADVLDTIRTQIINTYKWHSSLDDKALEKLMDAETWMDADEAIANGFATDKVEGLQAAAALDSRAMSRMSVPDKYRARVEALVKPAPAKACATCKSAIAADAMCYGATGVSGEFCAEKCLNDAIAKQPKVAAAAEVLRICREGECLDLAEALVAENATLETVSARVAEAKQQRAAAQARRTQIEALCKTAKVPELAVSYIDGGMSVAAVQAQLTVLTAKFDRVEIDGGLPPDHGKPKARIDTNAIYADMNKRK